MEIINTDFGKRRVRFFRRSALYWIYRNIYLIKSFFYLCSDEPYNRRNRNLRNLAATCTGLKSFVYQSYVPDYLELGIMFKESSERKEQEVYVKFLEQVNWRINKLRLVVTISTDLAERTFEEAVRLDVDADSLPLIRTLEVAYLVLDFPNFTVYCFISVEMQSQ